MFSSSANAAKMTVSETKCPFQDDGVRVYKLTSDNKIGGFDSDLASYSSGDQFRHFAISTCYNNLFSVYGKDIGLTIKENDIQVIDNAIKKATRDLNDPKNPTVWERYAIANAIYGALNASSYKRANLLLEASWTVRDSIVGFHRGLNGPEAVKNLLEIAPGEIKKDLQPEQRKLLLYNLARVAHRGGYIQWRNHYLNLFKSLPNLSAEDKRSATYFERLSTKVEPDLQRQALSLFKKSLSEKEPIGHRERALYLIADLNRRLGNHNEAMKGYKSISMSTTDKNLKMLSEFFIKNDLRMKPKRK